MENDHIKQNSNNKIKLSGCGSKDGEEIDGQEFDVDNLRDFIHILDKYKSVHLNYYTNDTDLDNWEDIDVWLGYNDKDDTTELKILMGNLLAIANALEDFKLKCYQRLENGTKEYQDFIMNNAPCNYDLRMLESELKRVTNETK